MSDDKSEIAAAGTDLEQLAAVERELSAAIQSGDVSSSTLRRLLEVREQLGNLESTLRKRLLNAADVAERVGARLRAWAEESHPQAGWQRDASSLASAVLELERTALASGAEGRIVVEDEERQPAPVVEPHAIDEPQSLANGEEKGLEEEISPEEAPLAPSDVAIQPAGPEPTPPDIAEPRPMDFTGDRAEAEPSPASADEPRPIGLANEPAEPEAIPVDSAADEPNAPSVPTEEAHADVDPIEERVRDITQEWANRYDTLPRAYLGSRWLEACGADPVVPSVLLRLAHHAFAPQDHAVPDELAALLDELSIERLSPPHRPGAWAVGAGFLLLHGWWPALPLFTMSAWTERASAVRRRTAEAMTTYWYQTNELFAVLLRRMQPRSVGEDLGSIERAAALQTLRGMLAGGPMKKFALGGRVMAHLRRELAWLEIELSDGAAAPSDRLVAWVHDLDPAAALDAYTADVSSVHNERIVGAPRAKLLRDLDDIRTHVRDWLAVSSVSAGESALESHEQAARDLSNALLIEGLSWRDGWGTDGSGALGRLLVERLMAVVDTAVSAVGGTAYG